MTPTKRRARLTPQQWALLFCAKVMRNNVRYFKQDIGNGMLSMPDSDERVSALRDLAIEMESRSKP